MTIRVFGADLSLNHGAVVELTDGERTGLWYYTNVASSAKKLKTAMRINLPSKGEKQTNAVLRLATIVDWLERLVVAREPDFAGIEDYAIRAEQGAHYLGEIGGNARLVFWRAGVCLRLHDPLSVKMFVTHDGSAQKDLVEEFVESRWGEDFSRYNSDPPKNPKHKQSRTTSEDLADAYSIAKLVDIERRIRSGDLTLKGLEHDQERRVFNRVTKTFPTSLLDRSWIVSGSRPSDDRAVRLRIEEEAAKPYAKKSEKVAALYRYFLEGER